MAQGGHLQVEAKRFNKDLELFLREYQAEAVMVVEEIHRLLLKDLMKRIFPKTKAEGEQAIDNDLRSMMVVAEKPDNVDFFHDLFEHTEHESLFDPDGNRIQDYHEERRNKMGTSRRSRVRNFKTAASVQFRDQEYFFNIPKKLHVKERDYLRYLRRQKKKVGEWKATFIHGLLAVGETAPNWVSRHSTSGRSQKTVTSDGISMTAFGSPRFNPSRLRKIIAFAIRVRRMDLNDKFKVRLKAAIRKSQKRAAR